MDELVGERARGALGGRVARIAVVVVWVVALVAAWRYGPDADAVRAWVGAAGPAGAAVYLGAYVPAVFALVPRPLLNAAAGLLFGLVPGVLLALVGGVVAALVQFSVARYAASEAIARRLPSGVVEWLEGLTGRRALVAVVQLRLVPVVPYQAVNYGFGLTRAGALPFALGTFLGGIPATTALVLVGAGGADVGVPVAVGGTVLAVGIAVVWWLRSRAASTQRRAGA
ncbi:putative membrane protein YdjX (TVP38/TMEM64 family) [Nocardiopsis sp. Huas11]|uniref:TVP38/TMEM64 family protein n=1 Tax=Nocardiopsis sp. Huas11 TaxID=2183912 RepID=UPI000EB17B05|nr:VTT domain-containing protein [Nocardiopsis sp. Huas11]RKS07969.1 putative membrane protein YdjX (TVP38/TMEM64 family) [Nocardiopsis sp. Huas11]